MVDCLDNPEICEAEKKYENEKKKFFKDREDDAREELIDSEKLLNRYSFFVVTKDERFKPSILGCLLNSDFNLFKLNSPFSL